VSHQTPGRGHAPRPVPEDDGRVLFSGGGHHGSSGWGFHTRTAYLPAGGLVGKTVNIGSKDGPVYEACTVTAFDPATGILTLAGGRAGNPWTPDVPPEPVTTAQISLYDIARGYLHPAAETTITATGDVL
jgi:hypothetical protein